VIDYKSIETNSRDWNSNDYVFISITILTCVQEVPVSNLGGTPNIPNEGFWYFSELPRADPEVIPRISHDRFLPNNFEFTIHQSTYSPRYAVTEGCTKILQVEYILYGAA
jgi:hypothetical protein